MAIFTTRDPNFAKLDRKSPIYVLVEDFGPLNETIDGVRYLGFMGWYTDLDSAIKASKRAIDDPQSKVRLTTINVEDTIVYCGDFPSD